MQGRVSSYPGAQHSEGAVDEQLPTGSSTLRTASLIGLAVAGSLVLPPQ
ncbi:MAG: hypothetical protein ABWY82_24555 [Tardiphaga sp.]